jgi:hypothetical protein
MTMSRPNKPSAGGCMWVDQPSPSTIRETIIFHNSAGPLVKYRAGILYIEDLNPEIKTKWRMSRGEMLHFGFCCILSAWRG